MKTCKRHYNAIDELIFIFDMGIKSLISSEYTDRESPAAKVKPSKMTPAECKHSEGLMRINHTGEVCAQALYQGQALLCRDKKIKTQLLQAAKEEYDHLKWCETRLNELNGRRSFLNPLWYLGSLSMGVMAGLAGSGYNLGFLAETEKQVEAHLTNHLSLLPKSDKKSQAILKQMRQEEVTHANYALASGAKTIPQSLQRLMASVSKIMTNVAYWV